MYLLDTDIVLFVFFKDRAKSLALAVSGEALPFEELTKFQPEKGAVLANATPIGMHPNKNRIPVSEVCYPHINCPENILIYLYVFYS